MVSRMTVGFRSGNKIDIPFSDDDPGKNMTAEEAAIRFYGNTNSDTTSLRLYATIIYMKDVEYVEFE